MERSLAVSSPDFEHNFDEVVELMRIQAVNPPGNDLCIGSCYKGLTSLIDTDGETREFFLGIYSKRPSLTPAHAVNLLFRAIQHIQLNLRGDRKYLEFETSEDWMPTLVNLLGTDDKHILGELMLTKDTITTKYQRYAGPRTIISSYWNGNPVNVADFGCGANVGLPGIEMNIPFEQITDDTPGQLVITETAKPMNLNMGLAIDKDNPESADVKRWSDACSYYPKELRRLASENQLEARLRQSRNTVFLQADLLSEQTPHMIPKHEFDAVILSTVLYQRTPEERSIMIAEAGQALKSTGIIIIQDFSKKNPDRPHELVFNGAWGGNEFGYRTFILRPNPEPQLLEVFQWSDGRCHSVRPGDDFSVLLQEK